MYTSTTPDNMLFRQDSSILTSESLSAVDTIDEEEMILEEEEFSPENSSLFDRTEDPDQARSPRSVRQIQMPISVSRATERRMSINQIA